MSKKGKDFVSKLRHSLRWIFPIILLIFPLGVACVFGFAFFTESNATPSPYLVGGFVIGYLFFLLAMMLGWLLQVFMLIDCALRKFKTPAEKIIWLLIIFFLHFIGAMIYYYVHGKKRLKLAR